MKDGDEIAIIKKLQNFEIKKEVKREIIYSLVYEGRGK